MSRAIALCLLLVLLFSFGCSPRAQIPEESGQARTEAQTEPLAVSVSSPVGTVSLLTELQRAYLASEPGRVTDFASGKDSLDQPAPVRFSSDAPAGAVLRLWEEGGEETVFPLTDGCAEVWNLKTGTEYRFCFEAEGKRSAEFRFATEKEPRLLRVDGVPNFRDLGGGDSGIRQGLLYRCARLNVTYGKEYTEEITPEGKEALRSLGIRTEIDLRLISDGEVGGQGDVIPDTGLVRYVSLPMKWRLEGGIPSDKENREAVCRFIHLLSQEENYPILFHCNIGTDRTGFLAFLIEALLGGSDEGLVRDYALSNFAPIGSPRDLSVLDSLYFPLLAGTGAAKRSEQAKKLLVHWGAAEEETEQIISILSE